MTLTDCESELQSPPNQTAASTAPFLEDGSRWTCFEDVLEAIGSREKGRKGSRKNGGRVVKKEEESARQRNKKLIRKKEAH